MTIEQTIQKAIEGGWDKEKIVSPMNSPSANFAKAMLDPLFWQSLGKALGWADSVWGTIKDGEDNGKRNYLVEWHRFVDHLAKGGTPESFFVSLDDEQRNEK